MKQKVHKLSACISLLTSLHTINQQTFLIIYTCLYFCLMITSISFNAQTRTCTIPDTTKIEQLKYNTLKVPKMTFLKMTTLRAYKRFTWKILTLCYLKWLCYLRCERNRLSLKFLLVEKGCKIGLSKSI